MFNIDILSDFNGRRYFSIYEHGRFHDPTAVIAETEARILAEFILAGRTKLPVIPDNAEIAREVARTREERGLSQEELAEKLGISRNYLSQIEQRRAKNISIDIYRRIAKWMVLG